MPQQQIKLDDRVEALRVEYGLELSDFWELPQKRGSYCAKHSALEVIAAKAKIKFDAPQVLEANSAEGIVSILVTGHFGDRTVWSVGECSPKNNKNSYPWAMAEKRGVDRVVLKLVGIHGLVYSEDEMPAASAPDPTPRTWQDAYKEDAHRQNPQPSASSEPRVAPNSNSILREKEEVSTALTGGPATQEVNTATVYARLWTKMETLDGDALIKWQNRPEVAEAFKGLPEKERLNLNDAINQKLGK